MAEEDLTLDLTGKKKKKTKKILDDEGNEDELVLPEKKHKSKGLKLLEDDEKDKEVMFSLI